MGESLTPVRFSMEFKQVEEINENKMHLTARVVQYTSWVDPRLAYFNRPNVSASLKADRLNMVDVVNSIWKPNIAYTELNLQNDLQHIVYLYPNGTIELFREAILTFTCKMDFSDIPSDEHYCHTTAYIQNDFKDTA